MPNLKSAEKRVRVTLRNRLRNLTTLRAVRSAVRSAEKAILQKKAEAEKLALTAIRMIDKAFERGILHKNAAARQKSRLVRKFRPATSTTA